MKRTLLSCGCKRADYISSSSLNRIENSLMTAMKRQDEKQMAADEFDEDPDETTPLTRVRSVPATQLDSLNGESLAGKNLRRAVTGTTVVGPSGMSVSPESTPSISDMDVSELGNTHGQVPRMGWHLLDDTRARSATNFDQGNRVLPPSPRASEDLSTESLGIHRTRNLSSTSGDTTNKANRSPSASNGRKEKDLIEVVADAKRELSKIRQKEQSQRPLRIVRQDKDHQPSDDLKEQFQKLADEELQIRRLNTRDWLRVATWWLLKVLLSLYVGFTLPALTGP